jgi:hypothetical protein
MARRLGGELATPQKHRAGLSFGDPSCQRPLSRQLATLSPRQRDQRTADGGCCICEIGSLVDISEAGESQRTPHENDCRYQSRMRPASHRPALRRLQRRSSRPWRGLLPRSMSIKVSNSTVVRSSLSATSTMALTLARISASSSASADAVQAYLRVPAALPAGLSYPSVPTAGVGPEHVGGRRSRWPRPRRPWP